MNVVKLGADSIPFNADTAITVGTFDGVHCGHQVILSRTKAIADEKNRRSVVVTFDPHPQIVLQKPDREPVKLLTTIEERIALFEQLGIDLTVVIPFSKEFAATPAEEFIRNIIVGQIGVKDFLLGHDHMFGRNRDGDETLLRTLGDECGFSVEHVSALQRDGIVVSSTKVRNALKEGDVEGAARMLGRRYSVTGSVVKGDGRGRALGIPTANIQPLNEVKLLPGNGVYVVSSDIDGTTKIGMANIGVRPTFTSGEQHTLEVNYLDVDKDLYSRNVTVTFHRFLRNEQKFASKEAFLEQLENDRQQTQTFKHTFNTRS